MPLEIADIMTFKELLTKCQEMRPVKRLLLVVLLAAAGFLFALVTAPRSESSTRAAGTVTASGTRDCSATKMRVSVFGRGLATYDWQSGNCSVAVANPRKFTE
jgi:hypothetical protein